MIRENPQHAGPTAELNADKGVIPTAELNAFPTADLNAYPTARLNAYATADQGPVPTADAAPWLGRSRGRRGLRFKWGVAAASVLALAGIAGGGVWAADANATSAATTAQVGTVPNLDDEPSGASRGGDEGPRGRFAGPSGGITSPGTTTSTEAAATTESSS